MRLPPKKKPGDPVLAADWNLMIQAIEARTPRSGNGLKLMSSSGGFAYSSPPPMGDTLRGLPPFSVIAIEKSEDTYLVTLKEGWVIDRPSASEVVFKMPTTGDSIALDTNPRPQIEMAYGDTLYCRIDQNSEGVVTGTPEVIVAETEPESTADRYHVKLFTLEDNDGTPRVKPYQQSDIEHRVKTASALLPFQVTITEPGKCDVAGGFVLWRDPGLSEEGDALQYLQVNDQAGLTLSGTQTIYVEVITDGDDVPQSATIQIANVAPRSYQAVDGSQGYYYYPLAEMSSMMSEVDPEDPEAEPEATESFITWAYHVGGTIHHQRLSGAGLDGYIEYRVYSLGSPTMHYYHKYVAGKLTAVTSDGGYPGVAPESYGLLIQLIQINGS